MPFEAEPPEKRADGLLEAVQLELESLRVAAAQLAPLQSQVADLEEKNNTWAVLVERLKQEYADAMQQWEESEEVVQRKQQELAESRRLEAAETDLELQRVRSAAERQTAALTEENSRLRDLLSEREAELLRLRVGEQKLQERAASLEQSLEDARAEVRRAVADHSLLLDRLAARDDEVANLRVGELERRSALEAAAAEKEAALRRERDAAATARDHQLRRFKELKKRYLDKKQSGQQVRAAVEHLRNQLADARARNAELEQRLSEVQAEQQAAPQRSSETFVTPLQMESPSAQSFTPGRWRDSNGGISSRSPSYPTSARAGAPRFRSGGEQRMGSPALSSAHDQPPRPPGDTWLGSVYGVVRGRSGQRYTPRVRYYSQSPVPLDRAPPFCSTVRPEVPQLPLLDNGPHAQLPGYLRDGPPPPGTHRDVPPPSTQAYLVDVTGSHAVLLNRQASPPRRRPAAEPLLPRRSRSAPGEAADGQDPLRGAAQKALLRHTTPGRRPALPPEATPGRRQGQVPRARGSTDGHPGGAAAAAPARGASPDGPAAPPPLPHAITARAERAGESPAPDPCPAPPPEAAAGAPGDTHGDAARPASPVVDIPEPAEPSVQSEEHLQETQRQEAAHRYPTRRRSASGASGADGLPPHPSAPPPQPHAAPSTPPQPHRGPSGARDGPRGEGPAARPAAAGTRPAGGARRAASQGAAGRSPGGGAAAVQRAAPAAEARPRSSARRSGGTAGEASAAADGGSPATTSPAAARQPPHGRRQPARGHPRPSPSPARQPRPADGRGGTAAGTPRLSPSDSGETVAAAPPPPRRSSGGGSTASGPRPGSRAAPLGILKPAADGTESTSGCVAFSSQQTQPQESADSPPQPRGIPNSSPMAAARERTEGASSAPGEGASLSGSIVVPSALSAGSRSAPSRSRRRRDGTGTGASPPRGRSSFRAQRLPSGIPDGDEDDCSITFHSEPGSWEEGAETESESHEFLECDGRSRRSSFDRDPSSILDRSQRNMRRATRETRLSPQSAQRAEQEVRRAPAAAVAGSATGRSSSTNSTI